MKKIFQTFIAMTLVSLGSASANVTIFKTINSAEMNLGWMVVNDLQTDGGAQQISSSWPVPDLVASFATSTNVTLSPSTVATNNSFWYSEPGTIGNKIMSSYLYGTASRGSLTGDTLSLEGIVTSYNFQTNAAGIPYSAAVLIQDFAADYSDVNQVFVPLSSAGTFQASLPLNADSTRIINWGLFFNGPNIWPDNTEELATAGSVTIQAIPEPSTYALIGLATVGGLMARRFRRRA